MIWQGTTGIFDFIVTERKRHRFSQSISSHSNFTLVILLMRLYAMYFHNKRVLAILAFVFVSTSAAVIYVMGRSLSVMTGTSMEMVYGSSDSVLNTFLVDSCRRTDPRWERRDYLRSDRDPELLLRILGTDARL